jgi:hypothetical protein
MAKSLVQATRQQGKVPPFLTSLQLVGLPWLVAAGLIRSCCVSAERPCEPQAEEEVRGRHRSQALL